MPGTMDAKHIPGYTIAMPTLINLLAFQMLWLLLVWSAFHQLELQALGVTLVWLAVHLKFSRHRRSDIRLMLLALLCGPLCDTLLIQLNLIEYRGYAPIAGLPPLWIYALWVNFSQLFNHSLIVLHGRPWLTAIMAMVSAPLAYSSGAWLGAAELATPSWPGLLTVTLCWGLILPLLMRFSAVPRA